MINWMRCNLFFATCLVLSIDFFLCFLFLVDLSQSQSECVGYLKPGPLSHCPVHHLFPSAFHIIRIFHMLEKESLMCSYTFCIKRSAINQGDVEKEVQQGLTH